MQNLKLLKNISLIFGSLEKSNALCIGLTHSCETISHLWNIYIMIAKQFGKCFDPFEFLKYWHAFSILNLYFVFDQNQTKALNEIYLMKSLYKLFICR